MNTNLPPLLRNRAGYKYRDDWHVRDYLVQQDFGARHYDPWLARWTTQDPMAGK